MSMEHALRFGGGENLFHRGYSDGLGFSAQQQCETNFQVRLGMGGRWIRGELIFLQSPFRRAIVFL